MELRCQSKFWKFWSFACPDFGETKSIKIEPETDQSLESGAEFFEKSDLDQQTQSVHNEKKTFRCKTCDYLTSRRGNLNAHVSSVHEGKKPFKCDFCDYNSSQHSNLNRHIVSIHEGTKPFKCSTHT